MSATSTHSSVILEWTGDANPVAVAEPFEFSAKASLGTAHHGGGLWLRAGRFTPILTFPHQGGRDF